MALAFTGCKEDAPTDRSDETEIEERESPPVDLRGDLEIVDGDEIDEISLRDLAKRVPSEVITSRDPYYERRKRYQAFSLGQVIVATFGKRDELRKAEFSLVAKDGYEVRIPGELAFHPAAYLAHRDEDHGSWQPIGDQGADPGPLYMVWRGDEFADGKAYPRPWGLAKIELLGAADAYRYLSPQEGFGSSGLAKKGYELFLKDCVRCHAINQDGGRVGPDLNVPQNILSYRPEQQVREYISNPNQFRYSTMPPHPDLAEGDLDGLIAYLRLMAKHQHDPHAHERQAEEPSP